MTVPIEPWVDVFEAARPRLLGLAYRMVGTISDAEDVVQEAFLRWHGADHATIEKPGAWLTTVTSRLALDRLRASKRRREEYVGPWLPEPVVTDPSPGPEDRAVRTESLTLGFLTRCFAEREPASLAAVTLLDRPYRRLDDDIPLDHVGFTVPDELFAGYGLGLDERWRALPDLHIVNADELPAAIDAA